MTTSPARNALTVVLPDLDLGGVPRVYVDLLRQLVRDGHPCRIIAPDGPLKDEVMDSQIAWAPANWEVPRTHSLDALVALLVPQEPTIVIAARQLSHLVPAAAASGPTVYAIHSSFPQKQREWFGARAFEQEVIMLRGLRATGRLKIMTIAQTISKEYAGVLDIPAAELDVLPPTIDTTRFQFDRDPPDLRSVSCVTRLSPEKHLNVAAAVELVRHRLSSGHPCRLDVVGDGPWRGEAERLCADTLPPGAFTFLGATDRPDLALRRCGVAVATGLTAMEAMSIGVRLVMPRRTLDDRGPLGVTMDEGRFSEAAAHSFSGRLADPSPPDVVWHELERLDEATLRALSGLVAQHHSTVTAASAVVRMTRPWAARPSPSLAAAARLIATLQDDLSASQRLADEIWEARQILEARLDSISPEKP